MLQYDIRSKKPLLLKDHQYGLPIKDIEFHKSQDLVLSMDQRILKIWDRNSVKFTNSFIYKTTFPVKLFLYSLVCYLICHSLFKNIINNLHELK